MTKCKFCNEWKKPNNYYGTLYASIAINIKTNEYYGTHMGCCNECKKPMIIMGPYMRVLQWMEKTSDYYGTLYVGIAMNLKNQWILWDPICGYLNECKKPTTITWSYMRVLHWM